MIKCTKRCLKKALGKARLTYEELLTILTEVECILNSRPLTYLYPDDLEEPLTPSHLISSKTVAVTAKYNQKWNRQLQYPRNRYRKS